MARGLKHGDQDLGPGNSGDFAGQITGMMGPMRELEPENIPPEGEGTFDVRDRKTGVVCVDDAKWRIGHVILRLRHR